MADLQRENKALRQDNKVLRQDLEAIRAAITRLELGPSLPLRGLSPPRPSSRSSHVKSNGPPAHRAHVPQRRSRSRSPDGPAKRPRGRATGGYLIVGPLEESDLRPTEFFRSLISDGLPTFTFAGSYTVALDPIYECHLRVALQSAKDLQTLLRAWNVAHRVPGMREVDSDGLNESVSHARGHSQASTSSRGNPKRGRGNFRGGY
ncbi:hypothetical protein DFH06DRAFT_1220347 [Mycena polygramma]|nr:hypothetical protein DFH06DRAFT_1220347 [Mycena polygramma]